MCLFRVFFRFVLFIGAKEEGIYRIDRCTSYVYVRRGRGVVICECNTYCTLSRDQSNGMMVGCECAETSHLDEGGVVFLVHRVFDDDDDVVDS